jgi:DNA polymerase-3 subunit gamma/tau
VRWLVTVSRQTGEPTLREQREARQAAQEAEVARHPLVQAIFATFPGAIIERINSVEAPRLSESSDEPED